MVGPERRMNWTELWPDLGPWLLRMAAVAVAVFWVVGAYNRLMRHRNALATAWGQIDELLTRRAAALEPLMAQLQEPMAAEANTLQALAQALERQQQSARAVRARPSGAAALQAWVVAEGEVVKPLRLQLAELAPRLVYARQVFNDAAEAYNQAVDEFPTRLLMPIFGFRPTARV